MSADLDPIIRAGEKAGLGRHRDTLDRHGEPAPSLPRRAGQDPIPQGFR